MAGSREIVACERNNVFNLKAGETEIVVREYSKKLKEKYPDKNYAIKLFVTTDDAIEIEIVETNSDTGECFLRLADFPACCGIAIVFNLASFNKRVGLASFLLDLTTSLCRAHGYAILLGTDMTKELVVTQHIAEKAGFEPIDEFVNEVKTGNTVQIWRKFL